MKRRPPCNAFTLIEMLVVMAVIAILTGIILSLNGLVQTVGARSRATTEIKALAAACVNYNADNGGYPQSSSITDTIDPNPQGASFDANPNDYIPANLFLWQQLSGHWSDTNPSAAPVSPSGTNYAADFFKGSVLNGTKNANGQITSVNYIVDPFGNPYCYSTAGLAADQAYRAAVLSGSSALRTVAGFNSTFDLWSTGGSTTTTLVNGQVSTPKWVKNW
jgi:prepilin-type N-terminal cleavage/methylation domain-containing protein